jgi:hypothetical protein
MGCSSCGFGRACSRPALIINGVKKAAYCPKARCSPQSLTRRLVPPTFLSAASSYEEALTVAQLDKARAVCAGADAALLDEGFCHAAPRLSLLRLLLPLHLPITLCEGTAPIPAGGAAGRDEAPAARSVPTRRTTAAWATRRARPSRVHAKSTGAAVGANAARGKAARAGARVGTGAGG